MFDLGWSEMAVILMVALIVIGPKDLPRVARTIGKWTAKARGMAREFQRSLDDMAREAELQDIKAEMDKLSRTDLRHQIEETIDPDRSLRDGMRPPAESTTKPAAPAPSTSAAALPPPPLPSEGAAAPAPTAPPPATGAAPPAEKG
jgi:sec-independent protein translocase protein TatB